MRALLATSGLLAACACLVAGAAAVTTELPQQRGAVDLLTQANLRIDGAAAEDRAGQLVAAAGDVNGDGLEDVAVAAPNADANDRRNSGSVYVVFGRSSPGTIDLGALGTSGFRIDGAAAGDFTGTVVGIGDMNGDGLDDLAVGAVFASPLGREEAGVSYVVYGKASPTTIDLASLGSGGFVIVGAAALHYAGVVASAGDVNGDGRPDLVVGSGGGPAAAYVVFGKTSTTAIDLGALGEGGYRIDRAATTGGSGSVAGAGDVNGDGRPDILIGAFQARNNDRPSSGSVYVVFGRAATTPVSLAALGEDGFRIDGAEAGDQTGFGVSGVGDLNGDGRQEILAGAPLASSRGRQLSGAAYVVFGKASTSSVDLAALGDGGFRIDGAAERDFVGQSVAAPGDIDGDGRPDLVVGAQGSDGNGREDAGAAFVVFGRSSTSSVDLASLGATGVRIDGAAAADRAGLPLSPAGDVNGDGRPDVLVGASFADNNGRASSGSVYVVYGFGEPRLAYAPLQAQVGRTIESHAPTQLARTGRPSFRVSPPLPDGLRLDGLGVVTGTPNAPQRQTTHRVTMTDLAGEAVASLVVTVDEPPDTTAPVLTLRAPSPQRARQGFVRLNTGCNEACQLVTSGRVRVGRASIRLEPVRAALGAAGTKALRLRPTAAGQKRLQAALLRGLRAQATITVRATDAAGNATTRSRSVRLR